MPRSTSWMSSMDTGRPPVDMRSEHVLAGNPDGSTTAAPTGTASNVNAAVVENVALTGVGIPVPTPASSPKEVQPTAQPINSTIYDGALQPMPQPYPYPEAFGVATTTKDTARGEMVSIGIPPPPPPPIYIKQEVVVDEPAAQSAISTTQEAMPTLRPENVVNETECAVATANPDEQVSRVKHEIDPALFDEELHKILKKEWDHTLNMPANFFEDLLVDQVANRNAKQEVTEHDIEVKYSEKLQELEAELRLLEGDEQEQRERPKAHKKHKKKKRKKDTSNRKRSRSGSSDRECRRRRLSRSRSRTVERQQCVWEAASASAADLSPCREREREFPAERQSSVDMEEELPESCCLEALTAEEKRFKALHRAKAAIRILEADSQRHSADFTPFTQFRYTPTVYQIPRAMKMDSHDDDLLSSFNGKDLVIQYSFSSPALFNIRECAGLYVIPELAIKMACALGYDAERMHQKFKTTRLLTKLSTVKVEDSSSAVPSAEGPANSNSGSALGRNPSRSEQCNVGIQAAPVSFSIGTQANLSAGPAALADLPLMQLARTLNEQQLRALSGFAKLVCEPTASNARDLHRLQQRLMDIYTRSQLPPTKEPVNPPSIRIAPLTALLSAPTRVPAFEQEPVFYSRRNADPRFNRPQPQGPRT